MFLEINDQRGPWPLYVGSGLCTWAKAYAGMECKFSAIMAKVWNESHIV